MTARGTAHPATASRILDVAFLIGVVVKGLDGMAELVLGGVVLVVPAITLRTLIGRASTTELRDHPHDPIAHLLLRGADQLHGSAPLWVGLWLRVHGLVKIAVVIALMAGARRVYPWAIGSLGVLTVVQIVELCRHPSGGLVVLTALDLLIIALTWREWREGRTIRDTWRTTLDGIRRRA